MGVRMKKEIKFIVLNALADGTESIVQFQQQYKSFLNRDIARNLIISEIKSLLEIGLIKIVYPADTEILEEDKIEDFWFELTELGEQEQKTMPFPRSLRKYADK